MTTYKNVSLEDMMVDLGIRVKDEKGQYRLVSEVTNDLMNVWNVLSNETKKKVRNYFRVN